MLSKRIIACLDVKDGRVVKGVQFRNHVDMGDILELSQRYADEGVDELVFYDISPPAAMVGLLIKAGSIKFPDVLTYRFVWPAAFVRWPMPKPF